MNKEQLIREMIQIELLYRTRQQMKLLNEAAATGSQYAATFISNFSNFRPDQTTSGSTTPNNKFTTLNNKSTLYNWGATNQIDNTVNDLNSVTDEYHNTLLLLDALFHYTNIDKTSKAVILRRNMGRVDVLFPSGVVRKKSNDIITEYNKSYENQDYKMFCFLWDDPTPIGPSGDYKNIANIIQNSNMAAVRYKDQAGYKNYFNRTIISTAMKTVDKEFQAAVAAGNQDELYPIFSVTWLKNQISIFENQILQQTTSQSARTRPSPPPTQQQATPQQIAAKTTQDNVGTKDYSNSDVMIAFNKELTNPTKSDLFKINGKEIDPSDPNITKFELLMAFSYYAGIADDKRAVLITRNIRDKNDIDPNATPQKGNRLGGYFFLNNDPTPLDTKDKEAADRFTIYLNSAQTNEIKLDGKAASEFEKSVNASNQDKEYPIIPTDILKTKITDIQTAIKSVRSTTQSNENDILFYETFFNFADGGANKQKLINDINKFCEQQILPLQNNNISTTTKFAEAFKKFCDKKNIADSQYNSVLTKLNKAFKSGWDSTKNELMSGSHAERYIKTFIEFGWSEYTVNDINKLLDYLNTDTTLHKFNDNQTFEYDMYRNSTKQTEESTGYNTGKGELLFIMYLKDSKTGGTTDRDILGSDDDNPVQYEIKQGNTESSECDFQTKVTVNTELKNSYSKVMTATNNFLKGFSESVKTMNKIMKLNSAYNTSWIKDTLMTLTQNNDYKFKDEISSSFFESLITNPSGQQRLKKFKKDKFDISTVFKKIQGPNKTSDITKDSNVKIIDYISDKSWNKSQKSIDNLKNQWVILPDFNLSGQTSTSKGMLDIETNKTQPTNALCTVHELLQRINELSDLENPILNSLNGEIDFKVSAASLKTCLNVYFTKVIDEYLNALNFYDGELIELNKQFTNASTNDIANVINNYKNQKNNSNKEFNNYLEDLNQSTTDDFGKLLDYKLFHELSDAFNFEEEAVIDIKRYDQDHKLTGEKKLINTIGDEFTIVEPFNTNANNNSNSNVDDKIDAFFADKNNDEEVTIKLKNNMDRDKFEKVMNNKSIFSFLNDNFDSKKIINRNQNNNQTTNQNNNDNKNLMFLLNKLIDEVIDIHGKCFEEYAEGKLSVDRSTKAKNKLNKGGLIYVSELRSKDARSFANTQLNQKSNKYLNTYQQYTKKTKQTLITGFHLLFSSDNYKQGNLGNIFIKYKDNFKSLTDMQNLLTLSMKNDFIKEFPNGYIPFIKEIDGSKIMWLEYNPNKHSNKSLLLLDLLHFKDDLNGKLKEIGTKLIDIAKNTKQLGETLKGIQNKNIDTKDMGKFAKPVK